MIVTETPRLIVRQFHLLDVDALEGIFGDPEVMRYGNGIKDRDAIARWLQDCLSWYFKEWGFGPWAVTERENQKVIGYCGLFYFPDICGSPEVEVGYRFVRTKWGKGLATEAATAVRDYAFDNLGLDRLIALVDPSNIASSRVAEKIGMKYEKDYMAPNYDYPDRVYSLNRSNLG